MLEIYEKVVYNVLVGSDSYMNSDRLLILGNRLKLIRAETKMKQKDFAAQFDIAPTTYSGYESGRHEPTLDFLIKIADKYELSLDYVVGRSLEKEGLIMDEFSDMFQTEIIDPMKQQGKNKIEILEEIYDNMQEQVRDVNNQLLQMREMINNEKLQLTDKNSGAKK